MFLRIQINFFRTTFVYFTYGVLMILLPAYLYVPVLKKGIKRCWKCLSLEHNVSSLIRDGVLIMRSLTRIVTFCAKMRVVHLPWEHKDKVTQILGKGWLWERSPTCIFLIHFKDTSKLWKVLVH